MWVLSRISIRTIRYRVLGLCELVYQFGEVLTLRYFRMSGLHLVVTFSMVSNNVDWYLIWLDDMKWVNKQGSLVSAKTNSKPDYVNPICHKSAHLFAWVNQLTYNKWFSLPSCSQFVDSILTRKHQASNPSAASPWSTIIGFKKDYSIAQSWRQNLPEEFVFIRLSSKPRVCSKDLDRWYTACWRLIAQALQLRLWSNL